MILVPRAHPIFPSEQAGQQIYFSILTAGKDIAVSVD